MRGLDDFWTPCLGWPPPAVALWDRTLKISERAVPPPAAERYPIAILDTVSHFSRLPMRQCHLGSVNWRLGSLPTPIQMPDTCPSMLFHHWNSFPKSFILVVILRNFKLPRLSHFGGLSVLFDILDLRSSDTLPLYNTQSDVIHMLPKCPKSTP